MTPTSFLSPEDFGRSSPLPRLTLSCPSLLAYCFAPLAHFPFSYAQCPASLLPSLLSSVLLDGFGKEYVGYEVRVKHGLLEWTLHKRYSDFDALHVSRDTQCIHSC